MVTGSLEETIKAIKDVLSSPLLCEEIAIRARIHVEEAHSVRNVLKKISSAIEYVQN